jgi:hypothetical protein
MGILKVASELGVGTSTVQRIKQQMTGPFDEANMAACRSLYRSGKPGKIPPKPLSSTFF